ncbi:AAA family ATPase [Chloroflexota bacterium]
MTDFLSWLKGVKKNGSNSWLALCPNHDDHNQSLSITLKDGRILLYCHAGCLTETVVERMGLTMSDLSPNDPKTKPEQREIEVVYQYTDANGKLFEVVRFKPKAFAQRRPDGAGGYIWDLKGIAPTLYHQDKLKQVIDSGTPIYVVEGERDCDNLWAVGLVSTTNPMGAEKWRPEHSETLKGASVIVLPDKDAPGQRHAEKVAASLHGKAKSIKVVELPDRNGLRVKDVSDWLAAGGSRAELERLTSETPEWEPPSGIAQAHFCLTRLSDLLQEPVEDITYIWDNTLIRGGLSILAAKPKVGKSTLARNLAVAVAEGETSFLERSITTSGPVVYLALEDKRSEVKKHFERMGATDELPIFVHTGSAPEKAIDELRKAVMEHQAVMAIVDPLQRLVRIPDLNDYSVVSLALEPLMQIARDTNCHLLLIHHATKGINRESGDSILGSTAIFGSVDCALIMKRSESYRTIESIQRYGEDLPRTVLTFDVGTGLTSSGGSLEDVELAKCGEAILALLVEHEMVEAEIKEGITDHKGGIVSKSLRLLCQGGKIQRQGLGKKGDPYLYTAVPKNAGDSRDGHIEIPTIPIIPTYNPGFKNDLLPKTDGQLNFEAVLGRPVEKAIELWQSTGAPVIHLGLGENCFDLVKLFSNPDVKPEHLQAVKVWLEKVPKRRGE